MLPDLPDESVVKKARLEPGKMFLVDLEAGKIVPDDSVKEKYANRLPYGDWIKDNLINIKGWTDHSQANGTKVRVCIVLSVDVHYHFFSSVFVGRVGCLLKSCLV